MAMYSNYVSVKRRYSRSVNLERDIEIPDSIIGYYPTSRAIDGIERFLRSYSLPHSVRAWTLTGSYGTGKSAFAHYLTALCSPESDQSKINALEILKQFNDTSNLQRLVKQKLPESGLIRAVATAQREPIVNTVIRALNQGASIYWRNIRGRKPDVLHELNSLESKANKGKPIDNRHLIQAIQALAQASRAGILLIIDELGKNLEFSAQNQSLDDLYLLQQLAELPSDKEGYNTFIFGLLHQSFADYAHGLAAEQRNEWAKIQGRFEDIPFIESSERMLRLIGCAIDLANDKNLLSQAKRWASKWHAGLAGYDFLNHVTKKDIFSVFPLHPLSAIALPILCNRFSQNDRTLFTFLASSEPNSFNAFLSETAFEKDNPQSLKLHQLYDYFVESAGISISLRPQFQKWVEIHSRLTDAKHLDPDFLKVLKTIGILNLISTTGSLRASRKTVTFALCSNPKNQSEQSHWKRLVDELLAKGFLTWRKQIDELRIWEGSDFDIEKEISNQTQMLNIPLADLLNEYFPLRSLVVQRHSYKTGTLRYFERQYYDSVESLNSLRCKSPDSDGLICYWLGKERDLNELEKVPGVTENKKPVIIICAAELKALKIACFEYVALRKVEANATQLQSDGVARREVGQRILYSQRLLDEALSRSFNIASGDVACWGNGEKIKLNSWSSFQNHLSIVCNEVYDKGLSLWNELINRRELTSQGAAARRKLIEAMLENEGQERLGLTGYGPECSMFESLIRQTGLYVEQDGEWTFSTPVKDCGIDHVWKAIEEFCKSATESPINIEMLYHKLENPPYGVKKGVVPALLLSVLLYHNDDVSVYMDGTFIPVLGPEHFELFARKPGRFSVKHFKISGLRAQIFNELEGIFSTKKYKTSKKIRNLTILSIVNPLLKFIKKLPPYTLETDEHLSPEAKAVRQALVDAKDPDDLLFKDLPKACGIPVIASEETANIAVVRNFRVKLLQVLKELQSAYDDLLSNSKELLHTAFKIGSSLDKIQEDLRVRATYLQGKVIEDHLKRFIKAATTEEDDDKEWLEFLLMIIADKPPRVWTDDDVILFEMKLTDISRRFKNLEALRSDMVKEPNEGFDACRVTITKPDGEDMPHMVWIDRKQRDQIDRIAENFLSTNEDIKEALTAILIEKVFGTEPKKAATKDDNQAKDQKVG